MPSSRPSTTAISTCSRRPCLKKVYPGAEPPVVELRARDGTHACAALGYANRSQTAFSLPFESLPGFTLLANGDFIVLSGRPAERRGRFDRHRPHSQFQPVAISPRMRAGFGRRRAGPARRSRRLRRSCAGTLAGIARRHDRSSARRRPDLLIVDIGSNSGGNESGDWSARLFTSRSRSDPPPCR